MFSVFVKQTSKSREIYLQRDIALRENLKQFGLYIEKERERQTETWKQAYTGQI